MSVDANALERETLERKDREELQKIVGALGGKATSRTRKADLIDMILELTGVTTGEDAPSTESADAGDAATSTDEAAPAAGDAADGRRDRGAEADEKAGEQGSRPASVSSRRQGADQKSDGQKSDSQKSDSQKSDSQKSDGQKSDGQKSGQQGSNQQGSKQPASNQPASNQQKSGQQGSGDQANSASSSGDAGGQDQGDDDGEGGGKRRRRRGRNRDGAAPQDEYTGEPIPVSGVLDLRDDGYGFLRVDGMLPSKDDCYVSVKQVRQFGLRKGDHIAGGSRPAFRNEKNPAIMRIDSVNGAELEPGAERPQFETLTPVHPTERIDLSLEGNGDELTTRALDLLAPIGKGSRVLVLGPARSGKTTLLQTLVRAVEANEADAALSVIVIDGRPEEITEMTRTVTAGEVHATSLDASADDHVASAELAMARARRRAENGEDVVVIVDDLTRLARAQHSAGQGSGRMLGGLDVAAVETAKRLLGAGRALEDSGSLTVIAAATVAENAGPDALTDILVGAANVMVRLDGHAADRGVRPAFDVDGTATLRADLLLDDDGVRARSALRDAVGELPAGDVAEQAGPLDRLLRRLQDTDSNEAVLDAIMKATKKK